MVCLNFQVDGFPANPNRSPKMMRDVDLMKAIFGDRSCLVFSRVSVDTVVGC